MTSRAETSLRASRAASSTALMSQSSWRGVVCAENPAALRGLSTVYAAPDATVALKRLRLT